MWSRRSISANTAASARAASLSEATANFNSSEVPSTFSNCETRHVGRAADGRAPLPTAISRNPARAIVNFIRCLFIDDVVKTNQVSLTFKFKMQKIYCFFKSLLLLFTWRLFEIDSHSIRSFSIRTGRIALAVDTSGSIDESHLRRFAAEVASVLERIEPQLRLIVCNADAHQVYDLSGREGLKTLRGGRFNAGGGRDFRPAITEAAKWKSDLLIYLTDMQGDAGDEPAFPVLWAVPEGKAEAPWVKIVSDKRSR